MNKIMLVVLVFSLSPTDLFAQQKRQTDAAEMGFFVTSVGPGDGANLGGLAGADKHCQSLAQAVGSKRTWRAYLSTQKDAKQAAVNARDRIGKGPWHNAKGILIAADVEDLHYNNANVNYEMVLDEKGNKVKSRYEDKSFTEHDILTGSKLDGTAYPEGEDLTCRNWTSNGEGKARVGHSDRLRFTTPGSPWNSAHDSRGCSQKALVATGGAGLFYCFAAD